MLSESQSVVTWWYGQLIKQQKFFLNPLRYILKSWGKGIWPVVMLHCISTQFKMQCRGFNSVLAHPDFHRPSLGIVPVALHSRHD